MRIDYLQAPTLGGVGARSGVKKLPGSPPLCAVAVLSSIRRTSIFPIQYTE